MEFDKNKVYTAVNADSLRTGSMGYHADNLEALKRRVSSEVNEEYGMLTEILDEGCSYRFRINDIMDNAFFYLVEEPKVEVKPLSLNEIAKLSYENAKKRENNGGHISTETRAMLKHCATEVVEAVEAYTNWNWDLTHQAECKYSFASELADIICCCTIIAKSELIDLDKAVADCLEKNRKRAEGTGDKK